MISKPHLLVTDHTTGFMYTDVKKKLPNLRASFPSSLAQSRRNQKSSFEKKLRLDISEG